MNIAVLSGKGGTGKTLLSVNMAAASKSGVYIDCDVEEPNGHLFFKPENLEIEDVSVKIPKVEKSLCNGCRKCLDFCKFNAIAYIKNTPIIFDDVCHSCGGCSIVCKENAISEIDKNIGKIEKGISGGIDVYTGILNTGEVSGVPIIEKLLEKNKGLENRLSIIDCPPGSACIVMESIKDADYCVLVAEPTIFGVHNLNMVYELVTLFKKPFGVVLNKCLDGKNLAEEFCNQNGIKIIGRIPFDKNLGRLNSDAKIAVRESEKYKELFTSILETVKGEIANEATSYIER
ncbi:ATP-binding protein [Peptacetobacter sp.]|uniref:ATP-binding protein n=1 Tax=Peptacetobacter sp. TaxID=2991975 RepID=UPI00261219B7|nr:ATP-binding protein [Peptacetobacter sp.]